jgi:8-oxo-dGTP pyrophosphatase MutT (NUDIX family)
MPVKVDTAALIEAFGKGLPRFADGRVDFREADQMPVLTCFVECQGKLLLLKRSSKVRRYQGKWCAVAGFIDQAKPLEEIAYAELKAELGLSPGDVASLAVGEPYDFTDEALQKHWRVHPMFARLKGTPRIEIDWDHTDFEWVKPEELCNYDTVPMLEESMRRAIRAAID